METVRQGRYDLRCPKPGTVPIVACLLGAMAAAGGFLWLLDHLRGFG